MEIKQSSMAMYPVNAQGITTSTMHGMGFGGGVILSEEEKKNPEKVLEELKTKKIANINIST